MAAHPVSTPPETVFRQRGGILRTSQALRAGIHPRVLYRLRDEGIILEVSRGVFRLAELPDMGHPDLVAVALRIPSGVVCLVSALSFHGITTQVPHQVDVALPRRSRPPRMGFPPIRTFTFAAGSFSSGVEDHDLDGVVVPIYGAARTVVDCFKF